MTAPASKTTRKSRIGKYLGIGFLVALCVGSVSCVQISGGTWAIRSAKTPEDWPELTPVGEVKIRSYPAYRAATVEAEAADEPQDPAVEEDEKMDPMFMTLFRHIRTEDISMTAPVELGYEPTAGEESPPMASMAFLYRTREIGELNREGTVLVRDFEPMTYASVGVRGNYTRENFEEGFSILQTWLEDNAEEWESTGPPRYLGYNSPFVPKFMRYGEVQMPVRPRPEDAKEL